MGKSNLVNIKKYENIGHKNYNHRLEDIVFEEGTQVSIDLSNGNSTKFEVIIFSVTDFYVKQSIGQKISDNTSKSKTSKNDFTLPSDDYTSYESIQKKNR